MRQTTRPHRLHKDIAELKALTAHPDFTREAARAQLIIKVAPADEVMVLVNRIHDSPRPVIEEASALLRSFSE